MPPLRSDSISPGGLKRKLQANRRLISGLMVMLLPLVAPSCASTTASAASTLLMACPTDHAMVEPHQFLLLCGDGAAQVSDIRWTSWTDSSAKGTGTYDVNGCVPSCGAGRTVSYPATLVVDTPQSRDGAAYFTTVTVAFEESGMTRKMSYHLFVPCSMNARPLRNCATTTSP